MIEYVNLPLLLTMSGSTCYVYYRLKKFFYLISIIMNSEMLDLLVACVLSGNSKQYLGKEYTEQQINEMDCNSISTLINRYESISSAQMT